MSVAAHTAPPASLRGRRRLPDSIPPPGGQRSSSGTFPFPRLLWCVVVFLLPGCAQTQRAYDSGSRNPAKLQILAGDAALERRRLEDAHHHYERALALARDAGVRAEEILALNQLGIVAEQRGALKDAYDLYLSALRLQQSTSSPSPEVLPELGLADVSLALGRLEEGKQHAEAVLEGLVVPDRYEDAGLAHRILGEIAERQSRTADAEFHFRRATLMFSRSDWPEAGAATHLSLGRILRLRGEPRRAVVELSAARQTFARLADPEGQIYSLMELARSYVELEQPRNAVTFWARAAETAREHELQDLERTALYEAVQLADQHGQRHNIEAWLDRLRVLSEPEGS